jgi:hypothetical protein
MNRLFTFLSGLLVKRFGPKSRAFDFEQEKLLAQKRALFHKSYPTFDEIRKTYPELYTLLKSKLDEHDPITFPTLKEQPYKYDAVATTSAWRIGKATKAIKPAEVLEFELSLWFNRKFIDDKKKAALMAALIQ